VKTISFAFPPRVVVKPVSPQLGENSEAWDSFAHEDRGNPAIFRIVPKRELRAPTTWDQCRITLEASRAWEGLAFLVIAISAMASIISALLATF